MRIDNYGKKIKNTYKNKTSKTIKMGNIEEKPNYKAEVRHFVDSNSGKSESLVNMSRNMNNGKLLLWRA